MAVKSIKNEGEKGLAKFGVINIVSIAIVIALAGVIGVTINKTANPVKQEVAAVQSVSYDGVDGKTALELLKDKAQVKTEESALGIFVQEVNGTANNDDHFWIFYVDGQMGTTSADQYKTKNGEKIEWRYEKIF